MCQAVAGQMDVSHSICNETLNAVFLIDISTQCHIYINIEVTKKIKIGLFAKTFVSKQEGSQ